MARPVKSGIDYFPLDTVLDTKFELIEAEFGLTGFAIIVKLLQKIYGEQGYYCEWTNEVALLFSHKTGGGNAVSEIVSAAIKRGIFDKDLYDKYSILTSKGIQERYFEAVNRRVQINVIREYLLISDTLNSENVNINSVSVNINSKNADRNTQIKEKESKLNKSKVNESKNAYGEYAHVKLTDDEFNKLQSEYGNAGELIKFLDEYIEMKGYKAKNHYLCIRKWVADAVNERKRKKQPESVFADSYKHIDLEAMTR